MLHVVLPVFSGLTSEAFTFPCILHYTSTVSGMFVLSSPGTSTPRFPDPHPPSALCPLRLMNISLSTVAVDPQTLFNQSQGLGTHHVGPKEIPFPSVLQPPFPSSSCCPSPATLIACPCSRFSPPGLPPYPSCSGEVLLKKVLTCDKVVTLPSWGEGAYTQHILYSA